MADMSVVDHFDKAPEAGFSRGCDAEAARRQFNVSLALIAALAFGVGSVAYTMRSAPKRPVTAAIEHVEPHTTVYGSLVRP